MNIYQPVEDFEKAIAEYTGAPYACVVNSCTNALLLACAYNFQHNPVKETHSFFSGIKRPSLEVTIPKHTYIGVPMSIIHAGGSVKFEDDYNHFITETLVADWQKRGIYQLKPYPIWDSARWLTGQMYANKRFQNGFVCISLHWGKTLNLGQGGVILHSDPEAQEWFKKARFDGRTPGVHPKDDNPILGWHCYMSPRDAADALTRLHFLPKHNDPLPPDDYPDLSKMEVFK